MPGHTQGPWRATRIEAYGQPDRLAVSAGDPELVLVTHTFDGREAQANAQLIATAPELLAVCEATLDYWQSTDFADCEPGCDCIVDQMRAAIAKARGA